ncbi:MAG: ornithine carbamoyltransferase [Lentisphaerae bacterium]|nr:ornithine carbamoyltransferase [Lentisphaerota bacterium]
MLLHLKGRSLLTLNDLSDAELAALVERAQELKAERRTGRRGNRLAHRHLALLFEKHSTRTRCAAAVAAADEGGCTEYLGAQDSHLGGKESVADTARVLGRLFDGILFRGYAHATVEQLARHAGVPVWNGLTDAAHPTQALADLLTIREVFGALKGLTLAYCGDGRNNVAYSLMLAAAKTGMHFVDCTPPALAPAEDRVAAARDIAGGNGGSVRVVADPREGVAQANVVYTDVWASMGEEDAFEERVRLLAPYRVDMALMQATGGLDGGRAIFLHCLPALHDRNTAVTRERGALEVTDDVFEAPFSRVFEQAENRLHTMKALFLATLGSQP